MLTLSNFEGAGRREVATPGQLWFAPPELTQHPFGRRRIFRQIPTVYKRMSPVAPLSPWASRHDLKLQVSAAAGSPRYTIPFFPEGSHPSSHFPILLPRKAACLLFVPCS